ncbi:GNAT family N-acetyltransferase [Salinicola peritrichatus]|uniref:GNAT family N-acetyltransferase n=1 Tax=Salinicola peritrichatus TaxID=1267424 RepID=UPI000DA22927|nr:GNAT family N-acetyltransferase [Salinicola peritrichatus]
MSNVSLQSLSPQSTHVETVARWTYDAWGALYPEESWAQWRENVRLQCRDSGVPSVFVAVVVGAGGKDVLVGTASLTAQDMSVRPELTPWLASVFVPLAWRGLGIASALIARGEAEARNAGFNHCYLYTPDQQRLYARLGWCEQERLEYRGEWVTLMRLDLMNR